MSSLLDLPQLLTQFDSATGTIGKVLKVERYLADLCGCFRDTEAYERALANNNPLVYTAAAVELAAGEDDLHYSLGVIYSGLVGEGVMLLEDEATGDTRLVPLQPNNAIYVPGHTAHRTVNTGDVPLTYLGIYPARAGHDHGAIAARNFRSVVIQHDGKPHVLGRN